MLLAFTFSILLATCFCLPLAHTPLHLGLIILILALVGAIFTSITASTWFGLIIAIIYIGGILVIFAYFIAIIPNQNLHIKPILSILVLTSFMFLFFSDTTVWSSAVISPENRQKLITSFFYPSQGPILIAIILILFIALLIVVKISERNKGPFRPFSKYVRTSA